MFKPKNSFVVMLAVALFFSLFASAFAADGIRDIDKDPVKEALLETFVLFSQKINAKIIAEGIERAGELEKLKELG